MVCFALVGIILISCISTASAKSTTTYQGISSAGKCNENGWTANIGAPDIALTRPEYAEVDPKNPIRTIEGTIVETLISHEDVPWTDTSHDSNWLVKYSIEIIQILTVMVIEIVMVVELKILTLWIKK